MLCKFCYTMMEALGAYYELSIKWCPVCGAVYHDNGSNCEPTKWKQPEITK